jgi:hypothetical protein
MPQFLKASQKRARKKAEQQKQMGEGALLSTRNKPSEFGKPICGIREIFFVELHRAHACGRLFTQLFLQGIADQLVNGDGIPVDEKTTQCNANRHDDRNINHCNAFGKKQNNGAE